MSKLPIQVAVYGGGGFAREVAWLVQSCSTEEAPYHVVCFIDDNHANHGLVQNGVPVMGLEQAHIRFPGACVVGGVGAPHIRQRIIERAAAFGFTFGIFVHPNVERSQWIDIGLGTVICAGNILTTNIVIGQHVQINLDCTIGHDVVIQDYATLAPGVHVSGCVHIGQRAYIGTGAVIINGTQDSPLIIGNDAVIGAAACVTKPVAAGSTVVGVPAHPVTRKGA